MKEKLFFLKLVSLQIASDKVTQKFVIFLNISGIVLMDNINWLSFHSGYDFGYLLKLLTDKNLPLEENDFFESLRLYFPTVYDVKVST